MGSPLPYPIPTGDSSSGTPARTGLWDLSGLDQKTPILIQHGGVPTKHLDPGDAAIASKYQPVSALPGTPPEGSGLLGDLVKRPIQLYGTDPQAYLQFQQALFAAGFYGSASASSIPWGSDPQGTTYDAWKKVLIASQQAQSAGIDITPDELLTDAVKRHQAAQKGIGIPKSPLVIQQTDPATLRGIAQQAAQDALGRNLSTDEVNQFVEAYHRQEAAISKQTYQASQDTSGGTHVINNLTDGSAKAQAEEMVEKAHPVEAGANRLAQYVGVLQQLLSGGG